MTTPLINVLVRISRPELAKRAVQSVKEQSYRNVKITTLVQLKNNDYFINGEMRRYKDQPYHYNLFCNDLMDEVQDGWFFFLDDDDYLHNADVLSKISAYLTIPERPVICQFLRNGKPKPSNYDMMAGNIIRGKIGMPCLLLHHSQKDGLRFEAREDADYRFITEVTKKCRDVKFVSRVVVESPKRSHGKPELHGENTL